MEDYKALCLEKSHGTISGAEDSAEGYWGTLGLGGSEKKKDMGSKQYSSRDYVRYNMPNTE